MASFRPLTGILFFNKRIFYIFRETPSGFRPLTGILFFNFLLSHCDSVNTLIEFPSPYGDFVFQLCGGVG